MSTKTITDRGLTTTTRNAPWGFGFDKTTRQMEMVYYYQYCVVNNLITVAGQQSRTSLIKKTFNHKGGTGIIWNLAMQDWLKDNIPSAENDLYKLWLAYFTKHATVADSEGVVYAGLSVEAAYRKFLSDHIGGAVTPFQQVFSDNYLVADAVKFKLKKFFNDSVTMNDSASFILRLVKQFSDSYNLTDQVTIKQLRTFLDSYNLTDQFTAKLAKGFYDQYLLQDSAIFKRGIKRIFADSVTMTDSLKLSFIFRLNDSYTLNDSALFIRKIFFSDSFTMQDSLSKLTYIWRFLDPVVYEDETVWKRKLIFSDSFTMQDVVSFGGGGYNAEGYGQNGYNQ